MVRVRPGSESISTLSYWVRDYLSDLIGRIMERRIEPGKVFDLELRFDEAAEAYRAMDERRAIKALLRF